MDHKKIRISFTRLRLDAYESWDERADTLEEAEQRSEQAVDDEKTATEARFTAPNGDDYEYTSTGWTVYEWNRR